MSVAAENVVGVGAVRTYSAQLISECYYLFTMMHYRLINSFVTKLSCHNVRGGWGGGGGGGGGGGNLYTYFTCDVKDDHDL